MNNLRLTCNKLSKSFSGTTVFQNLSFTLSGYQSLLITGKNGSGKSTLLKIISNLIRESSGEIYIDENNNKLEREKWYLKTGLLAPYINLYDELTGYENLEFFYKLKTGEKNNFKEKTENLLKQVNLYEKRNEHVKNYSSGMKQRLKVAFAIMTDPEILIMDEPRTNLDKLGVELIYKISDEQKKKGILIVATNNDEDAQLCENSVNIEDYKE